MLPRIKWINIYHIVVMWSLVIPAIPVVVLDFHSVSALAASLPLEYGNAETLSHTDLEKVHGNAETLSHTDPEKVHGNAEPLSHVDLENNDDGDKGVKRESPVDHKEGKGNIFFDFYKKHISVADGNRCAMFPSCSRYAEQALEKHGFFMGWIMTCDRLTRCGRDEQKRVRSFQSRGRIFYLDTLEANDFWWFNETR